MIDKFIEQFGKMISVHPDEVRVEMSQVDESFAEINIYANRADVGKIIGKDGKMINALKTVISGCKAKNNISYRISVRPHEG